jgi:hypothetical protein
MNHFKESSEQLGEEHHLSVVEALFAYWVDGSIVELVINLVLKHFPAEKAGPTGFSFLEAVVAKARERGFGILSLLKKFDIIFLPSSDLFLASYHPDRIAAAKLLLCLGDIPVPTDPEPSLHYFELKVASSGQADLS